MISEKNSGVIQEFLLQKPENIRYRTDPYRVMFPGQIRNYFKRNEGADMRVVPAERINDPRFKPNEQYRITRYAPRNPYTQPDTPL
jgi:hypothetical protein